MMGKKQVLGRGLGALIPVDEDKSTGDALRQISVDDILPNPHQPRQSIDPEALAELAASIKAHGVIQPLIVTADPEQFGRYVLVAGERRLQAARLAGLSTVPAIVQEVTPQQQLELALVENIQRADLNPLEEAAAYQQLIDRFGLTQQEIADRVGRGRVSVANALRLLRLPDFVKTVLAAGQISEGHARALLGLEEDLEAMKLVLKRVISQRLSVRQTEELVRRLSTAPTSPKATRAVPPETRALEAEFARSLGTKVSLSRSKKGGRLTIHFYSEEDLQRLYELLVERDS